MKSTICAVAPLLASLFVSEVSAATPHIPVIEVTHDGSAQDCPDTGGMVSRVNGVTGQASVRAAGGVPAKLTLRVTLSASGAGYTAEIVAQGSRSGRRRIADIGADCGGLAEALAVTLAIIVDDEKARPADGPATAVLPLKRTAPTALPKPVPSTHLHVGLAGSVGLLEPAAAGFAAGGMLDFGPALVGVNGFYLPRRSSSLGGGEVEVSLLAAGVSGCWKALAEPALVAICGQLHVGQLAGEAFGFSRNDSESRPWIAPGLGASGFLPLGDAIELFTALQLFLPLREEKFSIDNVGVAHTTPPFGSLLTIGLSVPIN